MLCNCIKSKTTTNYLYLCNLPKPLVSRYHSIYFRSSGLTAHVASYTGQQMGQTKHSYVTGKIDYNLRYVCMYTCIKISAYSIFYIYVLYKE